MDDLRPEDLRERAFPVVRRGYDRQAVDAFVADVATLLADLRTERDRLHATLHQLGIDDPRDLAAELEAVGADVGAILDAARRAATEMRSRAAREVEDRLAAARDEAEGLIENAHAAAFDLRASAWKEGTALLQAALTEAAAIVETAEKDGLLARAEAEREALRLIADARRERDDVLAAARDEAELTLAKARHEAELLITAAREQADVAERRARELEDRRVELMTELETARASISRMEEEFEERRRELEEPEPPEEPSPSELSHWPDDDGSVRIVEPEAVIPVEPVDALELAAEVEALRGAEPEAPPELPTAEVVPSVSPPAETGPPPPGPETEEPAAPAVHQRAEPEVAAPAGEATPAATAPAEEPEEERPAPPQTRGERVAAMAVAGDESEDGEEGDDRGTEEDTGELEVVAVPSPEAQAEAVLLEAAASLTVEGAAPDEAGPLEAEKPEAPAPAGNGGGGGADDLASLFAALREETATAQATPPDAPGPEPVVPSVGEEAATDAPPGPVPTRTEVTSAGSEPIDPFGLRDRVLLPIQNAALRTIKRGLVELQNRALEHLRVAPEEWTPDRSFTGDTFSGVLSEAWRRSVAAGAVAAVEMAPGEEPPVPDVTPDEDLDEAFAVALVGAVDAALVAARDGGAGPREVAAVVSKVFRAWRTGAAEQHLRFVVSTAYHRGLLAGLTHLGVGHVSVVAEGLPCGRCPVGMAPWSPAGGPPEGTAIPPAEETCTCTIVAEPPGARAR